MAIKKDSVLEIKDAKETVQSYFSFKEENVTAFLSLIGYIASIEPSIVFRFNDNIIGVSRLDSVYHFYVSSANGKFFIKFKNRDKELFEPEKLTEYKSYCLEAVDYVNSDDNCTLSEADSDDFPAESTLLEQCKRFFENNKNKWPEEKLNQKTIVFVDTEVGIDDKKVHDAGACRFDGANLHTSSPADFRAFIQDSEYICGHNICHHDIRYIEPWIGTKVDAKIIDTLYLSPLLFPKIPYHKLVKDDKLQVDELNNPLNDSQRAMELFFDELNAFSQLQSPLKRIFCSLLYNQAEFQGFFDYIDFKPYSNGIDILIKNTFEGKICDNVNIRGLINSHPIELAYSLSLISTSDLRSITPPWLLKNFPKIENVIKLLRNTPCNVRCAYCRSAFDVKKGLKRIFGFDEFRTYDGEPLQELAAKAAVDGKSILAVFPTGGGKSITFQLPALMAGENAHGLTVVISPLQSLMKDQVDNLTERGIVNAVTINGLLDPIERKQSIDLVMNGTASLLYISPESLRSKTIKKMLLSRNIVRFVIDEAHCFSAWGQDFRVDYLYIGDFIRKLQEQKMMQAPIPVSCFTATAKQKVITDICDYFREKLGVNLELYTSSATRENLHYTVLFQESDTEKYQTLRNLIEAKDCPTIVYVSRTRRTSELAEKLSRDGFPAKPFNGKMDPDDKIKNQEAFINNDIKIIVATSAFGMGVDKKDVRLVIHYDISDSLENYVQEAGRAGRDPSLNAECYVLYNNNDLDKHFMLLNQTKLSIGEIQQVWKAIKDLTKQRLNVCCSPLEIARHAGWEDNPEMETRVKTAVMALENAGYIVRGQNVPRIYATSILTTSMAEASDRLAKSQLITGQTEKNARRILSSLISKRSIAKAGNDDAESRVDYIADRLGLTKPVVIETINLLRQDGLLADEYDMSAFIMDGDTQNKSINILKKFSNLEFFLLDHISEEGLDANYKELNDNANRNGISSTVKNIRTLIYYHTIKKHLLKNEDVENGVAYLVPTEPMQKLKERARRRLDICEYIIETLYERADKKDASNELPVEFSVVELFNGYREIEGSIGLAELTQGDIEDALLYLSKIGALKIEGGFLVLYNGMEIHRLEKNNAIQYKKEDYRQLDEFYKQRIQQIHIVGKYANLMVSDYDAALGFVSDYFQMEYKAFLSKYFKGEEAKEIRRNITPAKYKQLFEELSTIQRKIIEDDESQYIVVAAGPGSGKTKVLAHKLASLLLLEDVKHEQLLMLTFSRAAATEFKRRLHELIGNAAKRVEIKTFHSYCFDLLGKIGQLEGAADVVRDATVLINEGEVEPEKITKKVLVIDEAQDMDENEFALVESLISHNENLRVIAVGDDDQNIYEFRGSNSSHLYTLLSKYRATPYEMVENYRSCREIVELANAYASKISKRMKSAPITAVRREKGRVVLTHHTGSNMMAALVKDVVETYDKDVKTSVLTNTNDEALQILGLLQKHNIPARLIQALDGFNLYQMVEIRYFLNYIEENTESPVISDTAWEKACKKLESKYKDSTNLEVCQRMLETFAGTYQTKYKTDLDIFIKESKLEDFSQAKQGTVLISTIHKAKGREFDCVYMLLDNVDDRADEVKHKLYVGMTRAKNSLFVHYNGEVLSGYNSAGIEYIEDSNNYKAPEELIMQLTHRDVYLNSFKTRTSYIKNLTAGRELLVKDDNAFYAVMGSKEIRIGYFSNAFKEKLIRLRSRGFVPDSAQIRFIVLWKSENDTEEIPIVLPDVKLKKK